MKERVEMTMLSELEARAWALVPKLRERANEADRLGRLHDETIRDLIDSELVKAMVPKRLGGFELDWRLGGADQARWGASFRDSGQRAIVVNPDLMRPTDPLAIGADPSRAIDELGWSPTRGLERFLREMIDSRGA